MATAWEVLLQKSTLEEVGNTSWEHLNAQEGGGPGEPYDRLYDNINFNLSTMEQDMDISISIDEVEVEIADIEIETTVEVPELTVEVNDTEIII